MGSLRSMLYQFARFISTIYVLALLISCQGKPSVFPAIDQKVFNDYWYQDKAEISSYELTQSRYGSAHEGKVVLIFVVEDMSKSRQVKLDDPSKHPTDDIKVMKMNMNKEFITGIYKYSMMNSVFTPVDYTEYSHSLKLVASSQDWCGQTFTQYNWKGNRYEVQQMSYFESEGDKSYELTNAWLEDEIWSKIRVAPNTLPVGETEMIPSAFYIRLSHQENKIYKAETSLKLMGEEYTYSIFYPELNRTMEINFQSVFPYKIMSWKEIYGENEITMAHISNTIMSDYWKHNQPGDEVMREELKLDKK